MLFEKISNLKKWNSLSQENRLRIAKALELALPNDFEFYDCYGKIVLFKYKTDLFSLVPGAEVTLGYDPNNPFKPNPEQYKSWLETAEEWEISNDLNSFIQEWTTPLRQRKFEPMLVEVSPQEYYENNDKIVKKLADERFRLPTSDEWEYLCGSGKRTLFRWGNFCPSNGYPTDCLERELHKMPNDFGLHIADNPCNWEMVAEEDIIRSGDGGSNICGGLGFFMGWLTLATAFIDPYFGQFKAQYEGENWKPICKFNVRRIYPLT